MRLDTSKLENRRIVAGKTTARCPACAEKNQDKRGEHLFLNNEGQFGCILYPGTSAAAKAHRRRTFALCGSREIKPLQVRAKGGAQHLDEPITSGMWDASDASSKLLQAYPTNYQER